MLGTDALEPTLKRYRVELLLVAKSHYGLGLIVRGLPECRTGHPMSGPLEKGLAPLHRRKCKHPCRLQDIPTLVRLPPLLYVFIYNHYRLSTELFGRR